MDELNPIDNNADLAQVFFMDNYEIVCGVYLPSVGAHLPRLILEAFRQVENAKLAKTPGNLATWFIWSATEKGIYASVVKPPQLANFPAQLHSLQIRENAPGGIGTVLVMSHEEHILTYGGFGFRQIGEANRYALTRYDLEDLKAIAVAAPHLEEREDGSLQLMSQNADRPKKSKETKPRSSKKKDAPDKTGSPLVVA